MAKKYLLYIHNDKFSEEKEKSKLVNELLEQHYNVYTTKPKKQKVYIHTLKVDPDRPILEQQNDPKSDLYSANIKPDIEFCKHNAVKGMCKKGCK